MIFTPFLFIFHADLTQEGHHGPVSLTRVSLHLKNLT